MPTKIYEGSEAVTCESCGISTKTNKNGRPVSHAPGGYALNIKRGMYRCEASGSNLPPILDKDGNEIDC